MSEPYPPGPFGFTNERHHIENVRAFVVAAVLDGWSIEATYESESIESAAKLRRDGFVMSVLMREKDAGGKWRYEASISIWGPDGLAIRPVPHPYNAEAISAGLRVCSNCKDKDVPTERFSFAGRCCAKCLPRMRELHEQPGWNN